MGEIISERIQEEHGGEKKVIGENGWDGEKESVCRVEEEKDKEKHSNWKGGCENDTKVSKRKEVKVERNRKWKGKRVRQREIKRRVSKEEEENDEEAETVIRKEDGKGRECKREVKKEE